MYFKSIALLSLLLVELFLPTNPQTNYKKLPNQEGIAVIELFTSEGCSSCPPADKVLSRIIDEAEKSGKPIYGLSFHVDYWNRLGWKDPFSQEVFTNRQFAYAQKLELETVYTPQMIVNGKVEFVGSREKMANQVAELAISTQTAPKLRVDQLRMEGGQLTFDYSIDAKKTNLIINSAIVERNLNVDVKRGENKGRKLHHDNVVRVFQQNMAKAGSRVVLYLPETLNFPNSSLIIYGQNKETLEIISATRVALER